jgi:hypothetical protein
MKSILNLFICFSVVSCTNNKSEVIDEFVALYKHIVVCDSKFIDANITAESSKFVDKLTTMQQPTLNNIINLGEEYNFKDLLFNYYFKYRKELETNNTSESFYNFLALEGVPLFNVFELYKVNKEKSRVKPEIFIAIYKRQFGNNYLNWIKLVEEDSSIKYDLLYTLELFNKEPKELNDNAYKNWNSGTKLEFYEELSKMNSYHGLDYELLNHNRKRNIEILNETVDNIR